MSKKRKTSHTDAPDESYSTEPFTFTGLRGRNLREIERTLRAARRLRRKAYRELAAQRRQLRAAGAPVPADLATELAHQHWLSEFTPWTHASHKEKKGQSS